MRGLTSTQQRVLDFVRSFRAENQMPPTRAQIAAHFEWKSANAAEEHLQAIARKGHIVLGAGRARGIFDLGTAPQATPATEGQAG